MRIALIAEALVGTGHTATAAYVRALLRHLPGHGIEVEPVTARHRTNELVAAGLPHARHLGRDAPALYKRWRQGKGPEVGGSEALVHAPTLAFPPSDGRPLVVTVHDLHFHRHREWYPDGTDALDAMLARLDEADLVIVPTKSVAADVAAASRATDRVRVVPMGTQLRPPDDDERARTLERLEVEQPYVLWVGTVEARRNPEAVIRAFAEVTSKGAPGSQELALYLVGPPGWWSADMAQLLSERGLTERVRRLGVVPHGSLAAIYAGAEAFVFPSLAEGSAMPVLEAMACGAPVVASNRSSLPEVVGNAALLCDPSDDGALADALMKVLRDRELATDLGRLGRERAEQFPWDRTARETAAVYREALEGA